MIHPLLLATIIAAYYMLHCSGFIVPNHHGNTKPCFLVSSEEGGEVAWYPSEVVDDDTESEDDGDWIPDREKARRRKEEARSYFERIKSPTPEQDSMVDEKASSDEASQKRAVYTDEEEELIQAMGGKPDAPSKREPGYLGDSTLEEIATDYSVPVCYLADILCTWGVPVPISIQDRLGDLVTGEQAFAILEAITTLDVAELQDRYSNSNMVVLCDFNGIELRDAFQMAINEGWSLPFGVNTCLRVEQEEELIRALGQKYESYDDESGEYD
mmetsp:Transcript_6643/g.10137  ORF Transcript_6643/g.10137 Transcript_6643/m.10137 type:complete len:271 (+) Transcript_6643:75-887(+)